MSFMSRSLGTWSMGANCISVIEIARFYPSSNPNFEYRHPSRPGCNRIAAALRNRALPAGNLIAVTVV